MTTNNTPPLHIDTDELALHLMAHPDCLKDEATWESYADKPYTAEYMERFFSCPDCRTLLVECCHRRLLTSTLQMLKECSDICGKTSISTADQVTLAENINLIAHFTDDILTTKEMYGAKEVTNKGQ